MLGVAPLARSRRLVLISLDAALHWLGWLSRFSDANGLSAVERARDHVVAAREALG